jgi:hypothetical protein
MLFINQHGTFNYEFVAASWKSSTKLTACFSEYAPRRGVFSLSLPKGEGKVIVYTDFGVITRIRTFNAGDPVAFLDLIRSDFEGTSKLSGTDRVYSVTHFGGIFTAQHYNSLGQLMHTVSTHETDDADRVVTVNKFGELFPDCSHLYQRVRLLSTR